MQARFFQKLGFEVALKTIRKLGDYKPLYGYLFDEDVGDAKAWGHVDVNISMSENRYLITQDDFMPYEKITKDYIKQHDKHVLIYKRFVEVKMADYKERFRRKK